MKLKLSNYNLYFLSYIIVYNKKIIFGTIYNIQFHHTIFRPHVE